MDLRNPCNTTFEKHQETSFMRNLNYSLKLKNIFSMLSFLLKTCMFTRLAGDLLKASSPPNEVRTRL